MNIYKISQQINDDCDTYDSVVVYAESEDEARKIHPESSNGYKDVWENLFSVWVKFNDLDKIKVEYLGKNEEIKKSGVILASFNAG